jgi:hypothetical protein
MVERRSNMHPTFYRIFRLTPGQAKPDDDMKAKLSVTVDVSLVAFLDSLPGKTRSAKLEQALSQYRKIQEDLKLREELAAYVDDDDERREREAWEHTVSEAMWRD